MNLHPIVVVLVILLLCGGQQGCSGPSAEEVTAEAERVAYEKKITYRLPDGRMFEATVPIAYTATVSQCSVKDGCKTRHYFPSSQARSK